MSHLWKFSRAFLCRSASPVRPTASSGARLLPRHGRAGADLLESVHSHACASAAGPRGRRRGCCASLPRCGTGRGSRSCWRWLGSRAAGFTSWEASTRQRPLKRSSCCLRSRSRSCTWTCGRRTATTQLSSPSTSAASGPAALGAKVLHAALRLRAATRASRPL